MIPKPITREDKYYSYLINGSGPLPKPITRKEIYLHHLCVSGFGGGGIVTPEMIESAVNNYLAENPVQAGATKEQEKQIGDNKAAIEKLQEDIESIKKWDGDTATDIDFSDFFKK